MGKESKTILTGAITYSLISRVLKALPEEIKKRLTSNEIKTIIDGRGYSHDIDTGLIAAITDLGARNIAGTTTAHLKTRLRLENGKLVILDIKSKRGRPPKNKDTKEVKIKKKLKKVEKHNG